MPNKDLGVIILAAGKGKRMNSPLPKVLHRVGGVPMITRTIQILQKVLPGQIVIVASSQNIKLVKKETGSKLDFVIQKSQLGTADATRHGLLKVKKNISTVAVVNGDDSAFYKPETISKVFQKHKNSQAKITFVTLTIDDPSGLGRIVREKGKTKIVEEKDATQIQKEIKEVNGGLYFFDKSWLSISLAKIIPSPATGEYYLTDLISLAQNNGQKVETFQLEDLREWHGINTPQELEEANRKLVRKVHIMGIAGAGATAVAGIAKEYGFSISGCDLKPQSAYTTNLKISIKKGHDPKHLKDVDMLVVSPAVIKLNPKNKEVKKAKDTKIPVLTWQEFQAKFLQKEKFVIAVAGAYGKSTTTAMVAQVLIDASFDPTCEVGAKVISWGKNFRVGKSKYFVCEADEYNNNFLNYNPDIAVILNIAWEHPDFFKGEKEVINSYQKFIDKIKPGGTLIISPAAKPMVVPRKDINVVIIKNIDMDLSIIGDFRKENAAAALTVAKALNLDAEKARKSVETFKGLARRLELKGKIGNAQVYDDYAVQPYTIKTTADALKEKNKGKKVLLVLEPHTFSRIQTFFDDFVSSLKKSKVDQIYITKVFAAREHGNRKTLAQKLAKMVGKKAKFTGSLQETAVLIKRNIENFDIILSMGAGDVYALYDFLK